ncbi:MAG: hypothetical protein ACKOBS_01815 [Verrucomicrobiota bacterium]
MTSTKISWACLSTDTPETGGHYLAPQRQVALPDDLEAGDELPDVGELGRFWSILLPPGIEIVETEKLEMARMPIGVAVTHVI